MSDASVEERIQFLEEQNEGLKRSGILLLVLVFVMGATMIYDNFARAKVTETEGLIINTAAGKPRGALSAMPTGHLGMLFYDYEGKLPESVQYASIPYLDGFAIYDRNGRPRILLGMDDKDNPIVAVVSPEGKTLFSAVPPAVGEAAQPGGQPGAMPIPAATPAAGAPPAAAATPVATPTP